MIEVSREDVHAALAEPHRLAIVDALALGDLSPTELSSRTGQSSNLLAHHLGALERAGVIGRKSSEADGRKSYVSLEWTNPIVAATAARGQVPTCSRVVFVCLANSARSQMAASLFANVTNLPVASAGTKPAGAIHPFALAELARHGLNPVSRMPAPAAEVLAPGDLVVAVCDNAYESLGAASVALHWSIADPARGDAQDFSRAFAELTPRIRRLADVIAA